jgi:acyl-CoA synthetase (AMP-forming)/AMP-acid ligase II
MHIRALLARAAELFASNVACAPFTYAELHERVAGLAGALADLGVRAGDRVAVLASNGLPFLELYFACAHLDAVLVALNTRLLASELHAIVADAQACVLACDAALLPVANEMVAGTPVRALLVLDDVAGNDLPASVRVLAYADALRMAPAPPGPGRGGDQLAHLYYTSGTTGQPKGVMLSHRAVCAHAMMTVAELGLNEGDVWGHFAPMFHLADAWATFAITQAGGRHVMVPRFSAGDALATLAEEGITLTNLVPTMLNLMVKESTARARAYPRLRVILSGGAPIAPEVVRQVVDVFGCEYVQTYGMTETSPFLTMSLLTEAMRTWPAEQQLAQRCTTGRPVAGVQLRVVRDDGAEVARDGRDVGEILVRGETVTLGYWRQPEATAAAFTPDGFLRTGDLAVRDAHGYVTIVDRKKDVINTGGEKVYSTEVEHVLYTHSAVLEAAVFALPDPLWGEKVAAAIVVRADQVLDAAGVVAFCRERMAGFKVPREVYLVDALPRTGSGKIAKRLLRDRFGGG